MSAASLAFPISNRSQVPSVRFGTGPRPAPQRAAVTFNFADFLPRRPPVARLCLEQCGGIGMEQSTHLTAVNCSARRIGERWASALRARYANGATVKGIMADFCAAERTVKGWLMGQAPQQQHVAKAVNLFGAGIAAEIYAPESDWHRREVLRQRIDALEQIVRELRDSL